MMTLMTKICNVFTAQTLEDFLDFVEMWRRRFFVYKLLLKAVIRKRTFQVTAESALREHSKALCERLYGMTDGVLNDTSMRPR